MHSQYWERNVKNKNKQAMAQVVERKERPKPEWTTDFVDRSQYKLSESERIQKKAALQSKNRQIAKQALEERRKKLQMGIIDEQTRKVYETALQSKKIDINPPIRKNLTEMIRYERERRQNQEQDLEDELDSDEEDYEDQANEGENSQKQIKQAQNFIKKFQRAKKQCKIQRAVEILTNEPALNHKKDVLRQQDVKVNNFFDGISKGEEQSKKSKKRTEQSGNISQESAISSIEDTIKFMEEKLFAAKKAVEDSEKSFVEQDSSIKQDYEKYKMAQKRPVLVKDSEVFGNSSRAQESAFNKKSRPFEQQRQNKVEFEPQNFFKLTDEEQQEKQFNERMAEISQLRIKLKEEQSDDSDEDECMDTIRRMRELMDSRVGDEEYQANQLGHRALKENVHRDNIMSGASPSQALASTIYKSSTNRQGLDSEAEVSFSLTNNDDSTYQIEAGVARQDAKATVKEGGGAFSKGKNALRQSDDPQAINSAQNWEINTEKAKEKEYDEEYERVKQNLFKCLGDDEDEVAQSSESLMVHDKIDMWRQQLETEANKGSKSQSHPQYVERSKAYFLKQEDDVDNSEEEESYSYSNNFYARRVQSGAPKHSLESQDNFSQQASNRPPAPQSMKNKLEQGKNAQQQRNQLKSAISNISASVQKIEIVPLKIEAQKDLTGFDFRGSINIKKNVLSANNY